MSLTINRLGNTRKDVRDVFTCRIIVQLLSVFLAKFGGEAMWMRRILLLGRMRLMISSPK